MDFIWKRVRKSLIKRRPDNYQEKKEQLDNLKKSEKEGKFKIYYADGSIFNLTPSVPYAWQPIGVRIELPSFKSENLNLFGIFDADKDLELYSVKGSMTSEVITSFIDDFCKKKNNEKIVLVLDNASVHRSKLFKSKELEWKDKGLTIFYLPTYSPHLNLIEHLWRFMKYEWLDFNIYDCWDNLVKYVEKIAQNFGTKYTINFS